ncbi:MAG: formylglycine-generating enzyme family protein [Planctomycetia bacterium]|jgi:sulfatase modifying factor 1
MNAVIGTYADEMDMEVGYTIEYRRDRASIPQRSRRPEHRSRSAAPACVNGIHRRRNKRWTWGTSRGAPMSSVRSVASALAVVLASLAAAATAAPLVTIDTVTVGDPGNAATSGTAGPSRGSVNRVFEIAKTETTNTDYVKFLNAIDPSGLNQYQTYNAAMTSNTINGGILFNSGSAAGAKYSVRAGFADRPVTFVTWFSAARFANWLNNGATSTASTETGAYTLSGSTSGAPVARNANAQVFLPSLDEFTKAAYYKGGSTNAGYWNYATQSNSAPSVATVATGSSNVANYGGGNTPAQTTGVVAGNLFPNATSYYGLMNAFGNVSEFTDTINTANANQVAAGGANWRVNTANAARWGSQNVVYTNTVASDQYGFRVAAVPEPGAMVLAAVGLGGAFGGEYLRRRRRKVRLG